MPGQVRVAPVSHRKNRKRTALRKEEATRLYKRRSEQRVTRGGGSNHPPCFCIFRGKVSIFEEKGWGSSILPSLSFVANDQSAKGVRRFAEDDDYAETRRKAASTHHFKRTRRNWCPHP